MKGLRTFFSSVLAGIAISVGCLAELSMKFKEPFPAALVFSIGFIIIMIFELHLFSDRVGYMYEENTRLDKKVEYLLIALLGNYVGSLAVGLISTNMYVKETAAIITAKSDVKMLGVLASAVICGFIVFAACHGYRRQSGGISGITVVVLLTSAISLCGLEHSISNIFYYAKVRAFSIDVLAHLAFSLLGNLLGALLFSTLYELKKSFDSDSHRHHHHHHRHHHHNDTSDAKSEATENK